MTLPSQYDYGVLSTSIIYCCRPINYHAFMALQPSNYPHLELHFVPTLAELEWAISEAAFAHSGAMRVRRKCFVTPGGGSDEYVARVRKEMEGVPLYWRQAITVEVLEEELEKDEVFVTNKDPDLQPVSASNDSQDRFETVESDKSARKRRTVALAPVAEKAELQAIERQETDDPSSTVLALEEAAAGMDREEREIVDSAASSKAKSSGGQHEDGSTASPAWSRKRSRRESEGSSKQSSRRDSGEGAEVSFVRKRFLFRQRRLLISFLAYHSKRTRRRKRSSTPARNLVASATTGSSRTASPSTRPRGRPTTSRSSASDIVASGTCTER